MFLFKHFFGARTAVDEILEHSPPVGFYVYNLRHVEKRYAQWVEAFPRIKPYYAMKANPDKKIIQTLVGLGAGVDCASASEIKLATSCGATDIIFAHPCKTPHDIRTNLDISLTTVDSESELLKMALLHPKCKILIRIRADDPTARHPLGNKFGCDMMHVPYLLGLAKELKLQVVGVAFHVGSASNDPRAYAQAIQNAKYIHDIFPQFDMAFEVLDIGGGFCGRSELTDDVVRIITSALDVHFPPELGIRIMSEPGRYFVETAGTLHAQVIGYTYSKGTVNYYIADGVYGSFHPLLTRGDEYKMTNVTVVRAPNNVFSNSSSSSKESPQLSTVFGPTCDAADCLLNGVMLPKLDIGDYLAFDTMGAYGVCGSSGFNGYNAASFPVFYV